MNITTRQLEAFVQVARHRSFTQAAARMHITQAGLSAMIRQIEEQLSARLFVRTTRAVALSPEGQRFLPVAQRTLGELAGAVAEMGLIASESAQRLRVGVTPFVAAAILPQVLRRFAAQAPGVTVHVSDDEVNRVQHQVADGLVDLAFGSFFETRSGVRRERILCASVALVRPRRIDAEVARRPRAADWRTLDNGPLIALPDDNPVQRAIDRQLHGLGVVPRERRVVNHIHTALALVAAGHGMAVLPSFVQAATGLYPITVAPLRGPRLVMDVFRIVGAGRLETSQMRSFVTCFVEVAMTLGYEAAGGGK